LLLLLLLLLSKLPGHRPGRSTPEIRP